MEIKRNRTLKEIGIWSSSFILLVMLLANVSNAQTNDAVLFENITLSKAINKDLKLTFNHEGRITNNISQFHYAYGDFGINQKITKHLRVALDYVLVWKQQETRVSWRHQWYIDFTYKTKIEKRFELSFREMLQQQVQDVNSSETGKYPENFIRSKTTLKYLPPFYPFERFNPYFAWETYYRLNNDDKYGSGFNRNRFFMGSFYNFNKRSILELYYMIEKNFNYDNPPTNYVVGIGFERVL